MDIVAKQLIKNGTSTYCRQLFTCIIVVCLVDCVDFLSSEIQTVTSRWFRSAGQEEAAYWVEAEFSTGYRRRLDASPANESSSNAVFVSPFYFKYGPTKSFVNVSRVIVIQREWLFSQTSVYLGPFVGFPCRRLWEASPSSLILSLGGPPSWNKWIGPDCCCC